MKQTWTDTGQGHARLSVFSRAFAAAGLAGALATATGPLTAQDAPGTGAQVELRAIDAHIRFDRGQAPALSTGQEVRVYYGAQERAYVALFQIDTNGVVRTLHPKAPGHFHLVDGGREYRLVYPDSPYWRVDDPPGVGYLFIVASKEEFDFSAVPFDSPYGPEVSRDEVEVYDDPLAAIDDYVAALLPEWARVVYGVTLEPYYVDDPYDLSVPVRPAVPVLPTRPVPKAGKAMRGPIRRGPPSP